jgi:hypothetical protein
VLYEQVLGRDTALLHPQIAALHCGDGHVEAAGWMRIQHGSSRLCWFTGMLLRLPRPGERVRTQLLITRHGRNERWVRRFGNGPAICSQQTAGPAGELVERWGAVAFVFALQAAGDMLWFRQQRCQLRLGRLGIRLPRVLAPRIDAVVAPAPRGGVAVSVRAGVRPLGVLLTYEGVVDIRRTIDANRLVAAGPARADRRL